MPANIPCCVREYTKSSSDAFWSDHASPPLAVFGDFNQDPAVFKAMGIPPPSVGSAVQKFFTVSFGSLALGISVGLFTAYLTKRVHSLTAEPHVEVSLMFLAAYGKHPRCLSRASILRKKSMPLTRLIPFMYPFIPRLFY